jgi:NADPH2:quinone reductase
MKSVVVYGQPSLRCEIVDVPIPKPGAKEVLIKVVFCASNPRDWKAQDHLLPHNPPINQGNEMAGIDEAVGCDVYEFRKGDPVAAVHPLETLDGTYAEYATATVRPGF